MKKEVKKAPAKKAAPKAVAAKKPAVKATAKPAPAAKKPQLTPEQRYQMIQDAAYYIAERHGFNGDSAYFWSLAEAEINAKLI
ncbi:MAG: DUF2934 domain-containing protein [Spartobacteria bacterium]|nr:DUF2934 domain-containing protein [Spartobacteria bacterium]